jgi:hypothetical protein
MAGHMGVLLSCSEALGEMNSKTKKDELGDGYIYIYICPMYFSDTTKFFVGPTSGCYGLQVPFKAHLTEPLALAL